MGDTKEIQNFCEEDTDDYSHDDDDEDDDNDGDDNDDDDGITTSDLYITKLMMSPTAIQEIKVVTKTVLN